MKKILTVIAAVALTLTAAVEISAQTVYKQKTRQYRPRPGTVIGTAPGYQAQSAYTRFSAIVEAGTALTIDNVDNFKAFSGNFSMSGGALVNDSIFAGVMLKYSNAGAYSYSGSHASNYIIAADVRYYFPGYYIYPFVACQVGTDLRKNIYSETESTVVRNAWFYSGVKVGVKYAITPYYGILLSVGAENAGTLTTIPFTIGLQF